MSRFTIQSMGQLTYQVTVDGHDISNAVKRDGVRVEFEGDRPVVHLTLIPTEIHGDLDDADVVLTRAGEEVDPGLALADRSSPWPLLPPHGT